MRTPNKPGYVGNVDKVRYTLMKKTLLAVLPKKDPGLTQSEMFRAVKVAAPRFPGAHPWWAKCVQLDLEARGELVRDAGKPLRWRRA